MISVERRLRDQISNFSRKSQLKPKKQLVARWRTINGKLVRQWIAEELK